MSLRVLLADDHALLRQGIRALIEKQTDMEVVDESEDGREAVELALKLRPNIVLMDIAMPGMNGIEATRNILAKAPGIRIIALSMHADRRYVAGMLEAGARGFLTKKSLFAELERALRTVATGETYLCGEVASVVREDYVQKFHSDASLSSSILTNRQREVLQLVAEGNSTKQIAAILGVSVKTVDMHRQNLMARLDLHNVADLTKYAVREGIASA